jgi:ubiquitin C-terminal hydrolase
MSDPSLSSASGTTNDDASPILIPLHEMSAAASSPFVSTPIEELSSTPVSAAAIADPGTRRGLGNVGNTCYLNSAIQALRFAKPFGDLFASDTWSRHAHPDRRGYELAAETASLVKALCKPEESGLSPMIRMIVPGKFVRAFISYAHDVNDEIRFGAQADAAEAVGILLDGLHTQLSREVQMTVRGEARSQATREYVKSLESWSGFFNKEYSPLVQQFYGQTQTRVICDRCGNISDRYEPWNMLKLPIPNADKFGAPAPTLQECLAANFATEKLEDYVCEKCGDRGAAHMEHHISRFPNYVILALKRFTNLGQKVRARIPYDDTNINLSEWIAWPTLQDTKDAHYRVFATVEHMGSTRFGHYVMRARDKGEWLIFDDGAVHPSPIGGSAGPDTYLLFLERARADE